MCATRCGGRFWWAVLSIARLVSARAGHVLDRGVEQLGHDGELGPVSRWVNVDVGAGKLWQHARQGVALSPPGVKDAGGVGGAKDHVHRPVVRMNVRGLALAQPRVGVTGDGVAERDRRVAFLEMTELGVHRARVRAERVVEDSF